MTVVLDTNVVSEVMRGDDADAGVLAWLASLPDVPTTTVITRAEIMSGLALLPAGHRRSRLTTTAQQVFDQLGVCLPLTDAAADRYGELVATRTRGGRPVGAMDALIAAITLEEGATLATRDVEDFAQLGLTVIDPWQAFR